MKNGRTVRVEGVDLGAGPVTVWLRLGRGGVSVKKMHGRRILVVPLREAAEVIARRAMMPVEKLLDVGVVHGPAEDTHLPLVRSCLACGRRYRRSNRAGARPLKGMAKR